MRAEWGEEAFKNERTANDTETSDGDRSEFRYQMEVIALRDFDFSDF